MKVFSRKKFIESMGHAAYKLGKDWVDECDGKPVTVGMCGCFFVNDSWCIDVPEHVNCRCVVKPDDGQKEEKKVYTMKDFKEKNISVRVGQKHVKEFLQMCEEEGLRWANGDKATEFVPNIYGEELAIAFNAKFVRGKLIYCNAGAFKALDISVVDFEDIVKQPEPTRYKITIECDGTTTTACMEINGKEVKQAQAKRNPADKFSWRVGAETAFGRLWGNGEKKEPADGVREVKRPANVGEWVKIVNKFGHSAETYKNGDIRKVCKLDENQGWVYLEGEKVVTVPEEYVVLEGYKPQKKERPFKVGDRVVCVEATDNNEHIIEKHGRVIGENSDGYIAVEFDEYINGHDCIRLGKNGYCWNCLQETLRHE